jgi:hypothetical protein
VTFPLGHIGAVLCNNDEERYIMACFICNKESKNVYLCEEHVKELYANLVNGQGRVEEPSFSHHCNICGEYENRIIIEHSDNGYFCDIDIIEAYKTYSMKISLHDGILDSLADDGESIIQIEQYLSYLGVLYNRVSVKKSLIELLNKNLIYIAYTEGCKVAHIEISNDFDIEDYWFELTKAGKDEQAKIVINN